MKLKITILIILLAFNLCGFSQLLQMYKGSSQVYIIMNGSSSASSYLIVNNSTPAATDISSDNTVNGIINLNQDGFNYVEWKLGTSTSSFVFPFRSSGTNVYIPLTFTPTGAGDVTTKVAVGTYNTAANDNLPLPSGVSHVGSSYDATNGSAANGVIDRWFSLNVTSVTTPTVSVTFSYAGAENTTANPTENFGAQRWNTALTPDDYDLAVGSAAGVTSGVGTVVATGISSFSPWVLSKVSYPLPVTLTYFGARCAKGQTLVKWSTSSETNNHFFTVERSMDGNEYLAIGTVAGSGTSSSTNNYAFLDKEPPAGIAYYRLKQTDYDGKYKYFKPASSNCDGSSGEGVTIYPNPSVNGQPVVAELNGFEPEQEVVIHIINGLGQLVSTKKLVTDVTGGAFYQVNEDNSLAAGLYTMVSASATQTFKEKLLINR